MSVSRGSRAPRGFIVGRLLDVFDKEIAVQPVPVVGCVSGIGRASVYRVLETGR